MSVGADRSGSGSSAGGGAFVRSWVVRIGVVGLLTLAGIELAAQLFLRMSFAPLERSKSSPRHYFTLSENEILGYELARNFSIDDGDKSLAINAHGIREDDDDLATDRWKLALLGASVVFGHDFGMQDTIGELLEGELDPGRVKVLNFAVPGYGMEEHLENLKVKDAIYDADHVVFVLQAKDFAKRNTRYEGADNGLYRLYHRPRFVTRYVMGKLIYRYHKGGSLWRPKMVSADWYEWMYRGSLEPSLAAVREMNEYCAGHGCRFTLALLPAPCAYVGGKYQLRQMYQEIYAFAERERIDAIQMIEEFGPRIDVLADASDHLTREGNQQLAGILARHLRPVVAASIGRAGRDQTSGRGSGAAAPGAS